ncbi:hypothetical protein ACLD0W_11565 [Alloalcanivorax sp. C16-1]|uniref:hypothetical protein n=1 Tax=Alloalcanivorax sp. C16-1 TaxID=3390051 RepID=UPI003970A2EF
MLLSFSSEFRPAGLLLLALTLAACGGSGNDHDDVGGGDGGPGGEVPDGTTLLIDTDNAAAVLVHARLALEILPRLQRNANILVSQGLNGTPTCDNPDGVFQLTEDDQGAPAEAVFEDCVDPLYPSRAFDGRIVFDFTDPNRPYSAFSNYRNRINSSSSFSQEWSLSGGFSIRPEDAGNAFGNAVIADANVISNYTLSTDHGSVMVGYRFQDFEVLFDSTISNLSQPLPTLAGGGRLFLFNDAAEGWVRVSTPHRLTDPLPGNGFCYGNGELVVDGAASSRVQLDYSGADLMISVNGVTVISGECEALLESLMAQAGLAI